MSNVVDSTEVLFDVVVNHEGQYSVWASDKVPPLGWSKAGMQGTKQACLDYIKQVWTDMRPLSLQRAMGQPS